MLTQELNMISTKRLRDFAERIMGILPQYFWEDIFLVSTIEKTFLHLDSQLNKSSFTEIEKDLIKIALLFCDGVKYGIGTKQPKPVHEHPILMVALINRHRELWTGVFLDELIYIFECIQSHEGYNNTCVDSDIVLPLPKTEAQFFVCTYTQQNKDYFLEDIKWYAKRIKMDCMLTSCQYCEGAVFWVQEIIDIVEDITHGS